MNIRVKRYILIAVVLLPVVAIIGIYTVSTAFGIRSINALRGCEGEISEIISDIERWEKITRDEVRHFETTHLPPDDRVIFYKYSGEGFPYFFGYIAYDKEDQIILEAAARRAW